MSGSSPTSGPWVRAKLYLPPDFDPSRRYPTLVNAYGGPSYQLADETWNQFDYQTYLSGSKGVVTVLLDPAGSGAQGDSWRFQLHRGFGTREVETTIRAVEHLQRNLSYADPERTAIWGWSYGGFLALSVLGRDDKDVFK